MDETLRFEGVQTNRGLPEQRDVGVAEGLGAAFRTQNTIGSAFGSERVELPEMFGGNQGTELKTAIDGGNYQEISQNLEPQYRLHTDRFSGATTEADIAAIKKNIDEESLAREKLEAAGFFTGLLYEGIAATLDPTTFVPVAGQLNKAKTVGQLATRAATQAGASAVASETILQSTQSSRTGEETAVNIAASLLLEPLLPVGARGISNAFKKSNPDVLKTTVADSVPFQSAGAAANTDAVRVADDVAITSKSQELGINATPKILGPNIGAFKSESTQMRALATDLMENQFQVAGVDNDKFSPAVESMIKVRADRFNSSKEEIYRQGWKDWQEETTARTWLNPKNRLAGEREFNKRLHRALVSGDRDLESPAITQVAQRWRDEILLPFKDDLVNAGILPEGTSPKFALSYFHRSWSKEKLQSDPVRFKEMVAGKFKEFIRREGVDGIELARQRLSAAQNEIEDLTRNAPDQRPDEASEVLQSFGDSEEFISLLRESRKELSKAEKRTSKTPVLDMIKSAGGVKIGSPLATELQLRGITQKTRPDLFRKNSGLSAVDNFGRSPDDVFADTGGNTAIGDDGNAGSQFVTPEEIFDGIDAELAGNPLRSQADDVDISTLNQTVEVMEDMLDVLGLPKNAKISEVRAALRKPQNVKKVEAEIKAAEAELEAEQIRVSNLDEQELEFYANEGAAEIFDMLTGQAEGGDFTAGITAITKGPLKGKTIPLTDLEAFDYLDNNAVEVMSRYIREISAELEITNKFGRADMRDQVKAIKDEYDELIDAVPEKLKEEGKEAIQKEVTRLSKAREADVKLLQDSRDVLRNALFQDAHSGSLGKVSRSMTAYNFSRMLGGIVVSALPDVMRLVQNHGIQAFNGRGIKAFTKSIPNLRDQNLKNTVKREARMSGVAEVLLNSRVGEMADMGDPYAASGPIESFTRSVANIGATFSGANHWNQWMKTYAHQMAIERFSRMAGEGYEKLGKDDRAYLRALKIGPQNFNRIAKQLNKFKDDDGTITTANTQDWEDLGISNIFRAALRADVDSVIVTPGAGTKPLFARHPIGQMAFQFKSFFAASHQQATLRGMGQDQAAFLSGMLPMISLGMMVYFLKELESGRDPSDNVGTWVAEGLDRSGTMPLLMEINNMTEPFTGAGVYTGLSGLTGDNSELASRYRLRRNNFIESVLLGPSAGTAGDALQIGSDAFKGDISESSAGKAIRMIPGASHPGIKSFLNYFAIPAAKDAVAD